MSSNAGPSLAWLEKQSAVAARQCPQCGSTDILEDHAQGAAVCTNCGVVVADRLIDEDAEWRTFDDDTKDKCRVGGPTNILLPETMTTMIGFSKDSKNRALARTNARASSTTADKNLLSGFAEILDMASRLGLPQKIRQDAQEMFSNPKIQTVARGKALHAILPACLYLACRRAGSARTVNEICAVAKADKKDIGRAYNTIKKKLEINLTTIRPSDFAFRFCTHLHLPQQIKKAVEEVTDKANELGIAGGKVPITVVATAIFLITQMSNDNKRPIEEVAGTTGVSESTIRSCYRDDLQPRQSDLVPKWFTDWVQPPPK